VKIIKCGGHTFNDVKPKNPYGIVNEYRCSGCGLVVHTREARDFLEGKIS